MRTIKFFTFLAASLIVVFGCKNRAAAPASEVDMHNAQNSIEWTGVYKGMLPCASCQGIKVTLILKDDGTFEKTDVYLNDNIETFTETGRIVWNDDKTKITLDLSQKTPNPQYFVAEGTLTMLDADGNENKGELANMYILKKVELDDISGEYVNGEEGKGYFDKLTIKLISDNRYSVSISSGRAAKGCKFDGEGALEYNRITIDLSKIQPELKAKMLIVFDPDMATIEADSDDNKYDLMYFCSGGGSLIGEYKKK